MGYMDISIGGSDGAADLHCTIVNEVIKHCKKELLEQHSCFNTPSVVNIALSLETLKPEFWCHYFISDDADFWEELVEDFESLMRATRAYHKEEQDDNSAWHLKEFGRLHRFVTRLKKGLEDEDEVMG